ncbi:MAG: glycoside hydrolase family 38 C-terminal domain-containing protein, partial [Phycisphaerae bacterium]
MTTKQVMIVGSYHMDVVWRRTPAAQAAIRDVQFTAALDALRKFPQFCFEFDQAVLIREYLAHHPERLAEMRALIAAGRLDITGGEEAIPDTNIPSGEGLVRNILLGRLWFAETLGAVPTVANMDDAFGLNAQLPQIFKQFGYQYFRDARTPGLDRKLAAQGMLWEGLDGTRIFYFPGSAQMMWQSHVCNLSIIYHPEERPAEALREACAKDLPLIYCAYQQEEGLVDDFMIRAALDYVPPEGVTLRFALAREVLAEAQRRRTDPPVVKGEFNPSQPGTHTTRIGLKQIYRRAEWASFAAESLAVFAALAQAAYPADRLLDMWRKLSYVQFHDSLCGCHADSVFHHVMGYCRDVLTSAAQIQTQSFHTLTKPGGTTDGLSLFNPLPFPRQEPLALDLPEGMTLTDAAGQPLPAERHGAQTLVLPQLAPLGITRWPLVKAAVPARKLTTGGTAVAQELRVGPYVITPTHTGIKLVRPDWNRTLADGCLPEIRFRKERGTMWDEAFMGMVFTEAAGTQRLVSVEQGPLSVRLLWSGEIQGDPTAAPEPPMWPSHGHTHVAIFPDMESLKWEKELIFYPALERIDATVRLDFTGRNTQVVVAFPLPIDLASSKPIYEIPFGAMERRPYYELPFGSPEIKGAPMHLAAEGGKGAWPAQTWVAYGDKEWGMLVANQGTPSHRLMSGVIEIAVLRSPTAPSSDYYVPPLAMDNGKHEYHFALQPYQGNVFTGDTYRLGAQLNAPPLVSRGQL